MLKRTIPILPGRTECEMAERITSRRVSGLLVSGLAAMSLAACGSKPKPVSTKIAACPAGYITGEKPLADVSAADEALQAGIAELRSRTGTNVDNEVPVLEVKPEYLGAFDSIFPQTDFNGGGGEYFELGDPTKVDTPAEAFCHGAEPSQLYFSATAQAAIAGLGSVGIVVKAPIA